MNELFPVPRVNGLQTCVLRFRRKDAFERDVMPSGSRKNDERLVNIWSDKGVSR